MINDTKNSIVHHIKIAKTIFLIIDFAFGIIKLNTLSSKKVDVIHNGAKIQKVSKNDFIHPNKNPFPNPTDTIHVKGSDVGNKLKGILNRLFREGKVTKEQAIEASKAIDEFVLAAGEESELYSTKTNKKGVSSKYVKALQALGFDGIVQKESYNSGSPFTATKTGNETNTYGIFKAVEQSPKETTKTETTENPALKDVESTAKALEVVDELKSDKGFSFIGSKNIKGEKHKGLNFEELINRLATDFFGTMGVAKSKSTIESEIDALERLLMRPDNFKYQPEKAKLFKEELELLKSYRDRGVKNIRDMLISEAYHKAKADGSNPELVKAVEQLLGKQPPISKTETTEKASEAGGVSVGVVGVDIPKSQLKSIKNQLKEKYDNALVAFSKDGFIQFIEEDAQEVSKILKSILTKSNDYDVTGFSGDDAESNFKKILKNGNKS